MQCRLKMKRLKVKATAIKMEHPLRRKKIESYRRYRNGPLLKWSALSKEKSLTVTAAIEMQFPL
jgi:hypothetical protein